jgi:long-chain acyl-CoA synthetase
MQETVSFIKLIENRIKVGWNNPSICDYGEKAYTYGDVAKSIAQLHIIYSKAGIAKGDKIAMCGSNSSRWGYRLHFCPYLWCRSGTCAS